MEQVRGRLLTWKTFVHRLWTRINDHDIFGGAAKLSYYFLLALFPLLLVLVTVLGYFAEAGSELRNRLITYLGSVMPGSAIQLVHTTLDEISNGRGGGKISLGLLAAVWAASNGMGAITETLNAAYGVSERRPWWKTRLVSVSLTITLSVLIILALVIVLYGGQLGDYLAASLGYSSWFTFVWKILQWPIALFFLFVFFNLIYYFGPAKRPQQKRWCMVGTIVAVGLWLLISFGFRIYLHYFDSYSVTYGSLGAVIVLMLWFYFTGLAILVGGEINSELEQRGLRKVAAGSKE